MRIAETEIMSMSSKVHKSEIDIFRVPDSTSWPNIHQKVTYIKELMKFDSFVTHPYYEK